MLCFIALISFLAFLAVDWFIEKSSKPSFIQPRIIASGPYEPNPYYPEKKIVPDNLKELATYERINRVTE